MCVFADPPPAAGLLSPLPCSKFNQMLETQATAWTGCAAQDRFDADGRLKGPSLEDEMREVVDDLLAEPSHPRKLAA